MPPMPPPVPQPPSFAPPPLRQQQQRQPGTWSPAQAAAQQQQQTLRAPPPPPPPLRPAAAASPPPPPPPSLVLPRTAFVAPPPASFAPPPQQPPSPSRQQQLQQWQQQRGEPSSRSSPSSAPLPTSPRPSPSPSVAAASPTAPSPPAPSAAPALVIPRAGLMTVEERRAAFARAALRADASAREKELLFFGGSGQGGGGGTKKKRKKSKLSEGEQRTAEWHALRDARLTASAFGNALGFWPGGRAGLWEEKVGLGKAFRGNAATRWGTEAEPRALEAFVAVSRLQDELARGSSSRMRRRVAECRFEVLCEDDAHDWLGASPDGLIEVVAASSRGGEEGRLLSSLSSNAGDDYGDGDVEPLLGGVLEIKCPFNRGSPLDASPWASPPHYYVPQVQGLMAVTGREWCDLWCWTPSRGATAFRFERDRGYWAQAFEVLADFWWAHVVPGNQAVAAAAAAAAAESKNPALFAEGEEDGGANVVLQKLGEAEIREAARGFAPPEEHPLTASIVQRSRDMAERAAREGSRRTFSAEELEEAIRRTKE